MLQNQKPSKAIQDNSVRDEHLSFLAHVLASNVDDIKQYQNGNGFGTSVVDSDDRVWYVYSLDASTYHFKRFKNFRRGSIPKQFDAADETDMSFTVQYQAN
ncbi:hypothetical protein MZD04_gp005 [Pseudomonas phage Psa21]|uniref:Uncharacterized protein n=1 Tax=Pseudomonas phage Psa21 TaxID=2530023 RepID=A0A481W4Z5_9CAUD|nr:hypothetical protein MZD04_gp005 [Pseudomonas phage Psa21]QBJ02535.1 hypothetical protein PSA21_5 [Pseudomonas phage Psa21]